MSMVDDIKRDLEEKEARKDKNRELAQRISTPHVHFKTDKEGNIDIESFINALQNIVIQNDIYVTEGDFQTCLVKDTYLYDTLKSILDSWNTSPEHEVNTKLQLQLPRTLSDDIEDIKYGDAYQITIDGTHPKAKSFEWTLNEVLNTSLDLNKHPEIVKRIESAIKSKEERIRRREEMETILDNSRDGRQD